MASPLPTPCLTPAEGYRLWASSYDRELNPLLSLERRMLEPLLPSLKGLDVVDIGCGTGRWLSFCKDQGARRLIGIDPSPEMLAEAHAKLGGTATLICADCAHAPVAKASADLVFCNFALSYIPSPANVLSFTRNILRSGGSLYLSDMHPQTASELHWCRGVRAHNAFHEICTHHRTVSELIKLCHEAGFIARVHLEPPFGDAERGIFEENCKANYLDEIGERPAIYILQFTVLEQRKRSTTPRRSGGFVNALRGARFALGPTEAVGGELWIEDSRAEFIGDVAGSKSSTSSTTVSLDLNGYLILPGLVNAHDHLEFALFPRLGNGRYENFVDWAEDIHRTHAGEIARHRQIPKAVRLWWGGIRNLLCGVTTVCHHNPYEPEVFSDDFVIRVLKNYEWAHSLRLDPEAARKKTMRGDRKFFIHLAEGLDRQCADEIVELHRAGALDGNTVIIHGLGLGPKGSELLRSSGAGLVWCPTSNLFLFEQAMPFEEIRHFPKVALGSDSPLTAHGDLLDEVRCACQRLHTPPAHAYEYVTKQAAGLLGLRNGEGTLRIGAYADLVAVRDRGLPPGESLLSLTYRDVELVLIGGRVQLASAHMKRRLPENTVEGLQVLSVEGLNRWVRAPLESLFNETLKHLHGPIRLGGRQVDLGG